MTKHFPDGWAILRGALIFCPSQVQLPITREQLATASEERWPKCVSIRFGENSTTKVAIGVQAQGEDFFMLNLYEDGLLIGMDSTPELTVRNAAWVRSLMPEDAPRIVVSDKSFSLHAELPYGVTPEQIAATLVEHIEGWDTDDPDFSTW